MSTSRRQRYEAKRATFSAASGEMLTKRDVKPLEKLLSQAKTLANRLRSKNLAQITLIRKIQEGADNVLENVMRLYDP